MRAGEGESWRIAGAAPIYWAGRHACVSDSSHLLECRPRSLQDCFRERLTCVPAVATCDGDEDQRRGGPDHRAPAEVAGSRPAALVHDAHSEGAEPVDYPPARCVGAGPDGLAGRELVGRRRGHQAPPLRPCRRGAACPVEARTQSCTGTRMRRSQAAPHYVRLPQRARRGVGSAELRCRDRSSSFASSQQCQPVPLPGRIHKPSHVPGFVSFLP